jgi:hypothetical protein
MIEIALAISYLQSANRSAGELGGSYMCRNTPRSGDVILSKAKDLGRDSSLRCAPFRMTLRYSIESDADG